MFKDQPSFSVIMSRSTIMIDDKRYSTAVFLGIRILSYMVRRAMLGSHDQNVELVGVISSLRQPTRRRIRPLLSQVMSMALLWYQMQPWLDYDLEALDLHLTWYMTEQPVEAIPTLATQVRMSIVTMVFIVQNFSSSAKLLEATYGEFWNLSFC